MKQLILLIIWLALIIPTATQAQDSTLNTCGWFNMSTNAQGTDYTGRRAVTQKIRSEVLPELQQAVGANIWIGYPTGFDVPQDIQVAYYITGQNPDGKGVYLVIYTSRKEPAFYWLISGETEYSCYTDNTGQYCGNHGCGSIRVNRVDFQPWINCAFYWTCR